jgi:hypothetical protein
MHAPLQTSLSRSYFHIFHIFKLRKDLGDSAPTSQRMRKVSLGGHNVSIFALCGGWLRASTPVQLKFNSHAIPHSSFLSPFLPAQRVSDSLPSRRLALTEPGWQRRLTTRGKWEYAY